MSNGAYDSSFYQSQSSGSHRSATRIVPLVLEMAQVTSVLDIGCGVGTFLRCFADNGVSDLTGVDGPYVPPEQLMIDPARFRGHDLSQSLDLERRFDLVVSLEVAEHLDQEHADLFVDNICRHGDAVLFSAAIPNQGGTHHVNERWPSYWKAKFEARGYRLFDILRPLIWADDSVDIWYKQNILLFANADGRARNPRLDTAPAATGPLDIVHPDMFALIAQRADQGRVLFERLNSYCDMGGSYSFQRQPNGAIGVVRQG